jgi:hypothetical protein
MWDASQSKCARACARVLSASMVLRGSCRHACICDLPGRFFSPTGGQEHAFNRPLTSSGKGERHAGTLAAS